jgi:ubiquinone/menaquinone biosynthesis C-methylase UbiE
MLVRVATSVSFDRAAGYYDATRGFPPGVEAQVANVFARAGGLGTASRVLELGVGTGRVAIPLAARVGRYTGVDVSAPMLAQLVAKRGSLPIDLVRADAGLLPFARGGFDAVIGVHVFHLVPGWRGVLAGAARVLRPEGLLLHGGDDHTRGPAWRRWRDRVEAEFGVQEVGVPRAKIESFPEDEGWRPAGVHHIAFGRRLRPRTLIDLVAGRTWSMTWRLSDAQLERAVAELHADLDREFGGELDREVEIEAGFWVRAYRPPAA